jgi:hypothetical protein
MGSPMVDEEEVTRLFDELMRFSCGVGLFGRLYSFQHKTCLPSMQNSAGKSAPFHAMPFPETKKPPVGGF